MENNNILYNVTVKIDLDIHEEWLSYMKQKHIPDVMNTQCFLEFKMNKVLGQDESDGITYAIQYTCPNMATLHKYQVQFAPKLQQEHTEKYIGKFVAFRTLLELVHKG